MRLGERQALSLAPLPQRRSRTPRAGASCTGSSMTMSSSEIASSLARCSIITRLPNNTGCAIPSSARIRAARTTRGSSPSGNTTRFGACCARRITPRRMPRARPSRASRRSRYSSSSMNCARDAGGDGRPGDSRRDPEQDARVERERDDVVGPELHRLEPVQPRDAFGDVLPGECRQRSRRRHLHLLVDLGGSRVERTAEDEREPEHVVDLVRVVAAAGRDDRVGPNLAHLVRQDLRDRIRQREDDRLRRHAGDHLLRDRSRDREPDENVGALQRVADRARRRLESKARLVRIHLRPARPR